MVEPIVAVLVFTPVLVKVAVRVIEPLLPELTAIVRVQVMVVGPTIGLAMEAAGQVQPEALIAVTLMPAGKLSVMVEVSPARILAGPLFRHVKV